MAVKLIRSLAHMVLALAMMTGGLTSVEAAYPDRPIHLTSPTRLAASPTPSHGRSAGRWPTAWDNR